MLSKRPNATLPSLRSIEDIRGNIDLDNVFALNALYELGIDNSNDEHLARQGVWHPSSVGYCRRAEVLQYIKTPPTDVQPKSLKELFEYGHAIHGLVQRRLGTLAPHLAARGLNYSFEAEVPFDPETDQLFLEMGIGGTTDGILSIWSNTYGQRGIVEVKSQNDAFHIKLLKMKTAWPNHLMQAHIYAWRFDCPIIWVFYLNKSSVKREVKTQLFEQEIFDAAILYFAECNDFVRRGQLPPREETYLGCKDCRYRTMCKPEILRRKNLPNTVPVAKLRRR
jgi:CRISPR/Cas system-associated exonuclease Cas4 (RecB family)